MHRHMNCGVTYQHSMLSITLAASARVRTFWVYYGAKAATCMQLSHKFKRFYTGLRGHFKGCSAPQIPHLTREMRRGGAASAEVRHSNQAYVPRMGFTGGANRVGPCSVVEAGVAAVGSRPRVSFTCCLVRHCLEDCRTHLDSSSSSHLHQLSLTGPYSP
jgi:hypothetical protein